MIGEIRWNAYPVPRYTDTGRRYQRQRKATTKLTIVGGKLYALTCSALVKRYPEATPQFRTILDSYAVTDA
eukprot:tig00020660_g12526.t1